MPTLITIPRVTDTATLTEDTDQTARILICGDPVCPMTGTTTCNTTEEQQRRCPDC